MSQIQDLLSTIETSIDDLSSTVDKVQQDALKQVLIDLKQLDTDAAGNIKPTVSNLKLIGKISKNFENKILSKIYLQALIEFNLQFKNVSQINESYFSSFSDWSKPKELNEIERLAIQSTTEHLTERGINANITQELKAILTDNIKTGQSFNQINERVKEFIIGTKDKGGKLLSYSKQIATDAINTYSADYNQAASDSLGFEWYSYNGALVKDSRPICVAVVHKRWVHKSELGGIARGVVDGKQVSIAGTIAGTNASNILSRRGGFNCGHLYFGVPKEAVPLKIRSKFENK